MRFLYVVAALALFVALINLSAAHVGAADPAPPGKVLRHVVLFQFKADTTPEQVRAIEDAFRALPKKIDTIRGFEWGTDVSTEKLSQGFTHCFVVTFADAAGRDAYLPHPAHQEFVKLLKPRLEKALVIDYWSRS